MFDCFLFYFTFYFDFVVRTKRKKRWIKRVKSKLITNLLSTASHHIKHSPGSQSGRNSNLRVVIPNSGMSAPDDNNISYGEVSGCGWIYIYVQHFNKFNFQFTQSASTTINTKYSGRRTTNTKYTRANSLPVTRFIWCPRLFDELFRCHELIFMESESEYCSAH